MSGNVSFCVWVGGNKLDLDEVEYVFFIIRLIVERIDCYPDTSRHLSYCQRVFEVTLGITDFRTTNKQLIS